METQSQVLFGDIGSYVGLCILSVFRCGKDRRHKLPQQRSVSFEFFMRERSVEKAVEKLDRKFWWRADARAPLQLPDSGFETHFIGPYNKSARTV